MSLQKTAGCNAKACSRRRSMVPDR